MHNAVRCGGIDIVVVCVVWPSGDAKLVMAVLQVELNYLLCLASSLFGVAFASAFLLLGILPGDFIRGKKGKLLFGG
jgi:hypothetical protein